MAGALAGLAGCQFGRDADGVKTTDDGTRTELESETARPESTQEGIPIHDHSGESAGGGSLAPVDVHGTVYAAAMPGDDLSAKVANAIEAIPSGGTVIVTPRPNGEPWMWRETVTINLRETGGVTVRCRGMAMIEYTGDG